MDQSIDKKPEFRENLRTFFYQNKKKIIFILTLVTIILVATFIWKENQNKKNLLISEKYIKAGVLLSNNEKEIAVKYYEEIILSKNQFYSLLALNVILEKNLVKQKEKIFLYFDVLDELSFSKEINDLILFKKALYSIRVGNIDTGEKILKDLIQKESKLKSLALEIISE